MTRAFKTYDAHGSNMTSQPTVADLLEKSLQVSKLTQQPSTYRGRRSSVKILLKCFERAEVTTLDELEKDPLATAKFIGVLRGFISQNCEGMARSTLSQQYTQIRQILQECGANTTTLTMIKNSKQSVLDGAQAIVHPQETITQGQMTELLKILEGLSERDRFHVKGVRTTRRKKAMLRLYVLIACCYALRRGSILGLERMDFNEESFTYRLAKGGRKGEVYTRAMHPVVWRAYTEYLEHIGEFPLFTDGSWLSAGVKTIMTEAGVEAHNGRHGIHRFRRAFATYCYHSNIPLVDAAAGLNHADSTTTERVYQDINAKQQRASQRLADFADHFTGASQRLSEFEQQLEAMSPWMADMFSVGQPVFEDEALEPVFLDAMGNLAAHDEVVPAPMREDTTRNAQPLDRAWTTPKRCVANVVPAPRLELGTP